MRTVTREQFQKLIVAQALITILYIGTTFLVKPFLPLELQTYVNDSLEGEFTLWESAVLVAILPFLIWFIINLRALYAFKPNAPKQLLYITIVSVLFYSNFFEVFVLTNIEVFLSGALSFLNGVTITLLFFSKLLMNLKNPSKLLHPQSKAFIYS